MHAATQPPAINHTGLFYMPPVPPPSPTAKYSIYYVPADDAGCGWLRCRLPAIGLTLYAGWAADGAWALRYTETMIRDHDIVVFQRQGSGPALELMRRARARGQKVIYEIDDYALFTPTEAARQRMIHNHTHPTAITNYAATRDYIIACMKEADAITTTTRALADIYRLYNKNIYILPNMTHPAVNCRYNPPNTGRPTIAYAAALAHTEDAKLMRAVIPAVLDQTDADFVFFGDWPRTTDWIHSHENRIYRMDFQPLFAYYRTLELFDVGVAPLTKLKFTRCKSSLKGFDYLGAGVAPVLQDCDVYAVFTHRYDCLKARTTKDWIRAITKLVNDPHLRRQIVENGQNTVRAYSVANLIDRYDAAYREVLNRRR